MSDYSVFDLLIFQFILILLNAVFACAEIAVISTNGTKLKKWAQAGNTRAKLLLSMTENPAQFLATIQIGITLAGFLGSAFAADNFSDRIVDWLIRQGVTISPAKLDVLAVVGITCVLSYVTLILGELVPKRIAMRYAETIALILSYPLYVIARIFTPVVYFLSVSTNLVLRLIGMNPKEKKDQVTEEEIRIMVDEGTEEGTIDSSERKMIHNVFEFDDKSVSDVMTHRIDVDFLNLSDNLEQWEKEMIKTRHSVYPVRQDEHHVLGTLCLKDYLKYKNAGKAVILKKAVQPVVYVPQMQSIDALLHHMQRNRKHFAVVVDEYGEVCGIVTVNDLLEEIVGELEDDHAFPPAEPLIRKIDKNRWIIQGNAPIKQVAVSLDMEFSENEYDTFAGFIFSLMPHIPRQKENMKLTYKNLEIQIVEAQGHKIGKTLVRVIS